MSQIRKTLRVNCAAVESLIAESELDVEIQNFDDFVTKKDEMTAVSVQLMTNSDASWSLTMYPFENPSNKATYLRFKVVVHGFSELHLQSFKLVWAVFVDEKQLVVQRSLTKTDDNYNVNLPFFKQHVKAGSVNLRLRVTVSSVGKQGLAERASLPLVPIHATLKSLMNDASLSDFKFIVGQREFQVHKAILAASSPMMKRMFTVDMAESQQNVCEVSKIEPDTFSSLLAFVYCGELPEKFSEMAAKLYEAARYYQIDRLQAACALELKDNLTEDNALDMYKWVYVFADELNELKAAAWNLVKFNILRIFRPLLPMEPAKIDEVLRIRQMAENAESDFWKKNQEN